MQHYTDEQVAILNADRNARLEIKQQLAVLRDHWDQADEATRKAALNAIINNCGD